LAFLQGAGSSQWTLPVGRHTVSARGSQRWMSREERGTRSCRAPREPRKRSTEFSAALLPVPGHGRSDSVRPRMAIGGRHWVGGGRVVDCQTGSARSPQGRPQHLPVWERTDGRGFGWGGPIAYQAQRTSEGFGCRVPTGLRKEPQKRSVTELPAFRDGVSALARPRMTICGRHWVDGGCVVARQADFARSPRGRSHRPVASTARKRQRLRSWLCNRGSGHEATRPSVASERMFMGRKT
jgi:hypothetical protein